MDRNNRRYNNRGRGRSWNNDSRNRGDQRQNNQKEKFVQQRRPPVHQESREDIQAREQAIRDFKARQIICPLCGQPINEVSSAIADKKTGEPVHFDCALKEVSKTETVKENQKITYIGQGRFAVVTFENPRDLRHFTIEKIIEWEERNKSFEWRTEMAGLFSQVKKI